ncbi:MAG TPA: GNAT family protein [Alphaproteobacteria bacterium]|nr:GNAT family protein [Alphaproteobacteria bacterium]
MIRLTRTSSPAPAPARLDGTLVFLRPPQPDEWVAWAELRSVSRDYLVPWEPVWPPDALTETAYLRRVRRLAMEWKTDEGYSFHVFERAGGRLVGGIGMTQVRRGVAQAATLGYWVGQPFERRGYTTEAVRLISRFAFHALHLHRVEAACLPENLASQRVLEKAGFVREGYARRYLKIAGEWRDHLTFALLSEDADGAG